MKSHHRYISDKRGLNEFCQQLQGSTRLGLDTEFVGEDSFVARLELIQVSSERARAVIDVPAMDGPGGSMDPLIELLRSPAILKVLHAGRQDLELFKAHFGLILSPVFDTQVGAAMVGYGAQIGYAQLVQRVLGNKLEKAHTLTNWGQRPLTAEQVDYALADVEFLLPIHEHLHQRLAALGRLEWAGEEFERLQAQADEANRDPRKRYERIRGWQALKPRAASVLRELTAWREEEARRRNVPRGRIVRDEILLELARRKPGSVEDLRQMRGLSSSLVDRHGATLLKLIQVGLSLPASEHPEIPRTTKPDPDAAGRVELLQAVLKACAKQAAIAPTLLATTADIQALIDAKGDSERADLPLLNGWRRHLAGETVLKVLEGRASVAVDAETGAIRITNQD